MSAYRTPSIGIATFSPGKTGLLEDEQMLAKSISGSPPGPKNTFTKAMGNTMGYQIRVDSGRQGNHSPSVVESPQ